MTDQSIQSVAVPFIRLSAQETQSGHDRQKWAEGLILQLPEVHDGRNSWLINYGETDEAQAKRNAWNYQAVRDGRKPSCIFNLDTRSTGAAAPAPSSLAGGSGLAEFDAETTDVQSRYVIVHQLRTSADIQDGATKRETGWATTSDRAELMRRAADAIERLAALSPEAPAREGECGWLIEGYDSKRGGFNAQWWALHPDMGEDCQGWTTDSLKALRFSREADAQAYIDSIGWTEAKPTEHQWSDPPALTPRHEAPAEPVSDRYKLAELLSNPQELEAPAEGAGEALTVDGAWEELLEKDDRTSPEGQPEMLLITHDELEDFMVRARSSAPEARGNLLAVIHRDGGHRTLEVGVERAAAEAEKIVADLLSSAPEARSGEGQ